MIFPISMNTNTFNNMYSGSVNDLKMINKNNVSVKNSFNWLSDPIIMSALKELDSVVFDKNDIAYLNSLGLKIPFLSGAHATDFIKKSNIRISFEDLGSESVHAQYNYKENKILLNKKYRNSSDMASVLAIAEAILHESAHAIDEDDISSVQEELNNLGVGVLAHRYFEKKYPKVFDNSCSKIVNDGVNVYSKVFFDVDIQKKALIERVKQKYGILPAGDSKHPASLLAKKIKE